MPRCESARTDVAGIKSDHCVSAAAESRQPPEMTNPRPSASTFAIDGGAGEPVERVSLSTAAMDPREDDRRGSLRSLASLLFGSRALGQHVHRYVTKRRMRTRFTTAVSPVSRAAFHVFSRAASLRNGDRRPSVSRYHDGGGEESARSGAPRSRGRPIRTRCNEGLAARMRGNTFARESHQVARRRRSRSRGKRTCNAPRGSIPRYRLPGDAARRHDSVSFSTIVPT